MQEDIQIQSQRRAVLFALKEVAKAALLAERSRQEQHHAGLLNALRQAMIAQLEAQKAEISDAAAEQVLLSRLKLINLDQQLKRL